MYNIIYYIYNYLCITGYDGMILIVGLCNVLFGFYISPHISLIDMV